jgi:isoprenylcysteine carboxyl methyltransferase (ICMT) family protein YpbQ
MTRMHPDSFFVAITVGWLVFRLFLWRRSNLNAQRRISAGDIEVAEHQSTKQPLIYFGACIVIIVEIFRGHQNVHPAVTYAGLALWCFGLTLLARQLQSEHEAWSERVFQRPPSKGRPGTSELSRKPWTPSWPLRLELVGLALFCGAPLGAFAAWVFCTAHTRALKTLLVTK